MAKVGSMLKMLTLLALKQPFSASCARDKIRKSTLAMTCMPPVPPVHPNIATVEVSLYHQQTNILIPRPNQLTQDVWTNGRTARRTGGRICRWTRLPWYDPAQPFHSQCTDFDADKAVAMAEKKMGVNMSAAQNEKWTDKIRMMIEKWTGKKVPAKFSN